MAESTTDAISTPAVTPSVTDVIAGEAAVTGFTWDKRGRVVPTWVERDIDRLERLLGKLATLKDKPRKAARVEAKLLPLQERIEAQLAAFSQLAKDKDYRPASVEKFLHLEHRYNTLVGRSATNHAHEAISIIAAREAEDGKADLATFRRHSLPKVVENEIAILKRLHLRIAAHENGTHCESCHHAPVQHRVVGTNGVSATLMDAPLTYDFPTLVAEDRDYLAVRHDRLATLVASTIDGDTPEDMRERFKHYQRCLDDLKCVLPVQVAPNSTAAKSAVALMAERNHGLIESIAQREAQKGLREKADCCQQGFLGLLRAMQDWTMLDDRTAKFSSYATHWIKRNMDVRKTADAAPGIEVRSGKTRHTMSIDAPPPSTKGNKGVDKDDRADAGHPAVDDGIAVNTVDVNDMLSKLSEEERTIITRIAFLGATEIEVATDLGMTRKRLRSILDKIGEKLREVTQ